MGSLFQLLLRTFCCFTALFPNNTVLRLIRHPFVLRMYILVSLRAMFELFGQSPVCDTVVLDTMSCIFLVGLPVSSSQKDKKKAILGKKQVAPFVVSQVLSNCCWNLSTARHVRCVRAYCHLLVSCLLQM